MMTPKNTANEEGLKPESCDTQDGNGRTTRKLDALSPAQESRKLEDFSNQV
jgi:hypothetical protein